MAYNIRRLFVIVTLFLIMLFIEGIAVPRYRSNPRSQASLKPFASNSKLASNGNLPSIDTKNANKSIVTRNDTERNYDFFSDTFQKSTKTNRNKRQILLNKSANDTFFWNFNLNITRYGNIPIASKDSKVSFGKKHSVAVFAEGLGLRQTALKDMHEALGSVEKLIQDVHGEGNESVTNYHNSWMNKSMSFQKENSDLSLMPDFNISSSPTNKSSQSGETRNQIQSFEESPKESNLEATYQLKITEDENENETSIENENETSIENGREGRIWFNILEYGGKLLGRNKPTSGTETTQNLTIKLEIDSLKAATSSEFPVTPDIEAEKSQGEFNAHSVFLESTTKHPATVEVDQVENSELQHTLKQDECFDCVAENFELSDPSMKDASKKKSHPVKFSFTDDETIESFCTSILNKLELRELSNSEVSSSDLQLISENEKTTQRSSQNLVLGHKNLPNTLDEKDHKTYGTIIEDNFFLENNESKEISTDILNRFLNMFEGSGRSAETKNESALIADMHFDKLDHLPSVSDCEVYFNNKRHEKTLLNSNTDLSIKNTFDQDFEITTLSLQEMQLSIPGNISIQSFHKSFEKTDSETEKTSHEDVNTTEKKIFSDNMKTQSSFDFDELIGISESDVRDNRIQETTEEQRNGRIFNFFDLGSGREDQGRIESIRRWFPSFFGGSGARALEDSTEKFDAVRDNGSGETFLRNVEFSGDERIITVSERDKLDFDIVSEKNWGPLGILSLAESGSGREFAKSTEFTLDFENENDCDDCFSYGEQLNENSDRNSTDEFIDHQKELDNIHENLEDGDGQLKINTPDGNGTLSECDDCNSEIVEGFNTLNMNAKNLVTSEVPLTHINLTKLKDENEFDCNDCYSDGERLNKNVDRSSIKESVSHRGDLRDYDENLENCSCLHKNSPGNGTAIFLECDCNLDTVHLLNKPKINFESPVIKEKSLIPENLTKLRDEYTYDCNDCNHKINQQKVTETNTIVENLKINDNIESDISVGENKTYTVTFFNFKESTVDYLENTAGQLKPPITTKDLLAKHETNDTPSLRFMGTIFLTGSGNGGLFGEDDGGPINLVEEESTVSPILLSRRKARLDETINEPSSETGPNLHSRKRGRLDDSNFNDNFTTLLEKIKVTSQSKHFSIKTEFITMPSGGIHKMEDTSQEILDNDERKDVSFSSIAFNSPTRFPEVFETATSIPPRFCVAAKDCNVTLNERCITVNNLSSCDCGRTLVRHKETRKCVGKRYVETTLKLPAEMFDANLRNPESARYKQMSKKSIEMMWNLLKETPEAVQVVTEVNVRSFAAGSLIVKLNLVLAVETKAEIEIFKSLENKLQRAVRDKNLVEKSSLNIRNATVLSITIEINPCKSQELNYCNQNAYCIWNEDYPEMFTCHCKEHYQDVSSDSHYPGEMCIAKCSPLYCGPNGHCEILDGGKKHCLCSGLYFGERCEVPGMVILSTLSVAAFITLAVLFGVVICFKYKRSYSRSPTFKRSEEMEHALAIGRVSDAIALGESRAMKISKFTQLSTPVQEVPQIKVTRPTLNESSISCDFDSTFDSTPRNEEENGSSI